MTSKMRRASIETIERMVKDVTVSQAEATRDRRLSLTMMNCIWARNTDVETVDPVLGEVVYGAVPQWVKGSFYRVGPGIIQVGDSCYRHPFDMLSVLHKYTIGPDAARDNTYRNKIVDSKTRAMASNVALGGGGGGGLSSPDPFKTKLHRFTSLFQPRPRAGIGVGGESICDNCIDNICFFGNDMYILSDIAHMLKIHQDTLDTLAHCELEEHVPVKLTTSHPVVEEGGDTVWNVGTSVDEKGGYSYSVIKFHKDRPGVTGTMMIEDARVVASIPCRHKHSPAFFHSFGLSEDYLIFIEQPLYVDADWKNGHQGGIGPGNKRLRWKRNDMVYIYVVEKSTGNVLPVVYTSEPFFFFHVINAFQVDVDKYIYLDIMAYKDAEILSDLKFSHIERTDHVPTARPYRIKLPLNMETTSSRVLVRKEPMVESETMEFPRINYRRRGKENKYFYALGREYLHPNTVMKVDTLTGDVTTWKEPGHFVSEPVFIPRPAEDSGGCAENGDHEPAEDDGVLIFTLLSPSAMNHVQLVLLDAADLSEVAKIAFRANGTVTEGFHGVFVSDSEEFVGH